MQFLTVVSFVAAAVLLLLEFMKQRPVTVLSPEKPVWFAPDRKSALIWAVAAAVGTRLAIIALAYLALNVVNAVGPEETKKLLVHYGFNQPFPALESLFSRWDAPHYLDIARYGYTSDLTVNGGEQHWFIVFYPLLPALTALLKPVFGTPFNAATFVSWVCLAGACWWIYRLAILDHDSAEARRAVKFLLIFPAAGFLGAPYTESLFLLLTAVCLYALRKSRWWLAGLMGFGAALTRNLGLLLVVPFAVEAADSLGLFSSAQKLLTKEFWLGFLKRGAWMLLIPLGAYVYLLINQIAYGDPFAFLQIQADHWGQKMQAPWLTVLSNWNQLTGDREGDIKLFLWGPQLASMVAMLALLPFLMRRLRPAHASYLLVYAIVALTPAWLLSYSRYMMGCVPLFLGLASVTRKKWQDIVLTIVFVALMLFLGAGYLMWKDVY